MKVIVIGAGKVGYTIAESLSNKDIDIIVIDRNAEILKKVEANLDVLCIKGSGVSATVLLEAGAEKADLLIAVTNSDEVNMVCCLTAKKLGVIKTAARIRDPEYARELLFLKEQIGLDVVINPEFAAADEIARCLSFSPALNLENFARGRVKMIELKVTPEMPIVGCTLKDITLNSHCSVLIGAVVREGKVIVPNGSFQIEENDMIYIIGKPSGVYNFCKYTGKYIEKYKNIMILGGGRIAYYLTNILANMGMRVKIIEINKGRCMELSELLPNTLVIHADGTSEEVLSSEGIGDMDGFIAITGVDEENLLSSLLAKRFGVKKVVAKISRTNYINVISTLGIDNIISPKLITANQILKYVRGSNIESLYKIIEGQGEIVEFIADESFNYLNIQLKNLNLPEETLIATIVRKNEVVIPKGDDVIKKGDRVILITKQEDFNYLNKLSIDGTGGIQSEFLNGIKKLGNIINL